MPRADVKTLTNTTKQNYTLETVDQVIRKGALVLTPPPGIHKDVTIFDFSKFYPSILDAFNISKEIMHLPDDVRKKAPKGITPLLCRKLIKLREYYEAKLEEAFILYGPDSLEYKLIAKAKDVTKFRLNAVYGDGLMASSRFYDEAGMSLLLQIARSILLYLAEICAKYGWELVYGDTDSVMIKLLGTPVEEAERILQEEINKKATELGIETDKIKLKAEKLARIAVFLRKKGEDTGAKKKYIMFIIKEYLHGKVKEVDYPYIKGLDLIRGNTAKVSKTIQQDLVNALGSGTLEAEITKISTIISNIRSNKYGYDDIALEMNLGSNVDDYDGNPEHVKAVRYSNDELGLHIKGGDRFKMLFVKRVPGKKETKVLAYQDIEQVPNGTIIDTNKTVDRIVYKKIDTLIEAMGYSLEDVKGIKQVDVFF